jgi:hypothetical protein
MFRKILLTTASASLVVLILLVIVAFIRVPQQKQQPPTPTVTLVPTAQPDPSDLFIQRVLPPEDPAEPYLPVQKVTIVFSEEVEPVALKYDISPPTEVYVRNGDDKRVIFIIPKTKWSIGETTISILESTISVAGRNLYSPYDLVLITDIPPAPSGIFEVE